MALSTLTSKGQMTLPKFIRDHLGVDTGDKLEFIIDVSGHVFISPKTLSIDDIFGLFEKKQGISVEDMNLTIKNKLAKKIKPSETGLQ